MTTSTIKPEIKTGMEEILSKVSNWEAPDVEKLLNQMGSLLARKKAPHLSEKETALLLKINEPFPPSVRARYAELHAKLQAENISTAEHDELLKLVDIMEAGNVEWLQALIELARLRGLSLRDLMKQLGIKQHLNA